MGGMNALIHLYATILLEGEDIVRLGIRTLHTRRAHRHSRHREPHHIRSLLEQTRNHVAWNVTFDHIVFYEARMARAQALRDAMLVLDRHQLCLRHIDRGNGEALVL